MKITKRNAIAAGLCMLVGLPLAAWQSSSGSSRRLNFLAGYLSLTDAQKAQAQTIFDNAATAAETVRGQMESARTSLQTAIKANASAAELDRLSAAIGVLHGQATAIHAKAEAQFYALLTTEQRAKYDEMPGPGAGGPGGSGGGRGPNSARPGSRF
ncbi:Spy/CpxP family protein refolding chaperone [Nostoc sp. NIES-2111]